MCRSEPGRVSDVVKKKGPAMKKLPRISFIRNRPLDRDNVKNAQLSPQTVDTIAMLHESKVLQPDLLVGWLAGWLVCYYSGVEWRCVDAVAMFEH